MEQIAVLAKRYGFAVLEDAVLEDDKKSLLPSAPESTRFQAILVLSINTLPKRC